MRTASTCVWWRPWATSACALIAACTASADDVRPPNNQLFFPTGVAISPDERVLFAANANSELRYDSGSISVIDLDLVQQTISGWLATAPIVPDGCDQDPDHRETLTCDAQIFIKAGAGVRIGNFATDIAVQHFADGNLRVLVPTRGDPSISWADFDTQNQTLSCVTGSESFALCDDTHRLTTVRNDPALGSIPNEPYSVFADSDNGFAVVTHQSLGAVSLIESTSGTNAQIVDIKAGFFAQDLITGVRAATAVSGRRSGDGDIVYVGSRSENRIQTFTVGRLAGAASYLLPSNYFFLTAVGANAGGTADIRALQFSSDNERMYAVNRDPPSLEIYDTSANASGFPRNVLSGASDICREASTVSVVSAEASDVEHASERAYVTCFQDGQVYVVDPNGQSNVEDIITVGRGPYGIVAAQGTNPASQSRKQLFISNFLEDTIAVVDVTPSSANRNRVVLRIGRPRAP